MFPLAPVLRNELGDVVTALAGASRTLDAQHCVGHGNFPGLTLVDCSCLTSPPKVCLWQRGASVEIQPPAGALFILTQTERRPAVLVGL
jgi:hypothetical protein